jgi:hypothetical protein
MFLGILPHFSRGTGGMTIGLSYGTFKILNYLRFLTLKHTYPYDLHTSTLNHRLLNFGPEDWGTSVLAPIYGIKAHNFTYYPIYSASQENLVMEKSWIYILLSPILA